MKRGFSIGGPLGYKFNLSLAHGFPWVHLSAPHSPVDGPQLPGDDEAMVGHQHIEPATRPLPTACASDRHPDVPTPTSTKPTHHPLLKSTPLPPPLFLPRRRIPEPQPQPTPSQLATFGVKIRDFAYEPPTSHTWHHAPEIFDPCVEFASYFVALEDPQKPVVGKTLRRLLDVGWISQEGMPDRHRLALEMYDGMCRKRWEDARASGPLLWKSSPRIRGRPGEYPYLIPVDYHRIQNQRSSQASGSSTSAQSHIYKPPEAQLRPTAIDDVQMGVNKLAQIYKWDLFRSTENEDIKRAWDVLISVGRNVKEGERMRVREKMRRALAVEAAMRSSMSASASTAGRSRTLSFPPYSGKKRSADSEFDDNRVRMDKRLRVAVQGTASMSSYSSSSSMPGPSSSSSSPSTDVDGSLAAIPEDASDAMDVDSLTHDTIAVPLLRRSPRKRRAIRRNSGNSDD